MTRLVPIVLVGGRSTRFGRDKLREPVSGGWLVDRAIGALREATGSPVTLVGACAPELAARGDAAIEDAYPAEGPIGGLLTALERYASDVLVLAGDLPCIRADDVRALIDAARVAPSALCIRARGAQPEPCVAIYRASLTSRLASRLRDGRRALIDVPDASELVEVSLPEWVLVNANTPRALREAMARVRDDGVWPFEEIDEALDLVPIAARRALDVAMLHLSLEGWRGLPIEGRRALVLLGAQDEVVASRVTAIASGALGARSLDRSSRALDAASLETPPPAALEPRARGRLEARWPSLTRVERFAISHAAESAARRGDPARLSRAIDAILGVSDEGLGA